MNTTLIITVDTEEEGLWSDSFKGTGNTVRNIQAIPAFQSVCENHGIEPVYLINSPVIENKESSNLLRSISGHGKCEIGCHIHPWNTHPIDEDCSIFNSYLCNLDTDTQAYKLEHVTRSIENQFGLRPKSFRAGRYGLDIVGAQLLKDLGYSVDSSVCPFTDYSADGGPDFRGYPWVPYYIGDTFENPASNKSDLLEVPVSFGYNWRNFSAAFRLDEVLTGTALRRFRIRGILDRLNLLNKIKFSPEKHKLSLLKRMAKIYAQNNSPSLVMMFHSSSLVPGLSPYVNTETDLKSFLHTIDSLSDYCINSLGMNVNTLEGFSKYYDQNNYDAVENQP
jgi:hypothetical protein